MRSHNNLLPALFILLAFAVSAQAADSGDDVLGALFRLHASSPSNDAAICTAAAQAVTALSPGPDRAAARTLLGWRLLRAGKPAEAKPVYQALLDDPASPPAFTQLARCWLTRLDRDEVRAALQKAWIDDIQYPSSLDGLAKPLPPMQDRWGQAWRYRPAVFKRLKTEAQRYTLESPELGADSDLAAALERPWPKEPSLRAIAVNTEAGATPVVTFQTLTTPSEKILMTEGKTSSGLALVRTGPRAMLIVEGDYAFLIPNPGN
jgi:hypothetical protein